MALAGPPRHNLPKPAAPRRIAGIDLGGRTTAKTAVAALDLPQYTLTVCSAAEVADRTRAQPGAFAAFLRELNAEIIGIDAPLTLPDLSQDDYLFRPGDREAGAMSPFSIGEITARAIHLTHRVAAHWLEVYPKTLAQWLGDSGRGYKNAPARRAELFARLQAAFPWAEQTPPPDDADTFDALLALAVVDLYVRDETVFLSDGAFPFAAPGQKGRTI